MNFDDVYAVVRLIPNGKVSSYGAIAAYLGSKRGARLVGWAMNSSHGLKDVPAHRVVNRNGLLSGQAFFAPGEMKELLESEGVTIVDNQIQNFEWHFWDPSIELMH